MTTRRRTTKLAALLLAGALLAAACGGDDDDGGASDTAGAGTTAGRSTVPATGGTTDGGDDEAGAPEDADPNGILRIGTSLDVVGGLHFDPTHTVIIGDLSWMQLVIGTLLRENAEGGFDPFLAESYEVVDPQTVTMQIREGVTYTDGGVLTAEHVAAAVLRTARESATEAARAGLHTGIRGLEDAEATGPNEVTFTLSTPTAGEFVAAMASREGTIVSPKQLAEAPETIETAPEGAGPFVLEEYRPLQIMSLRKNPDFYDADNWHLGGIDFVHTPLGPPGVTGLLSGTLDMVSVQEGDVERVEADDKYEIVSGYPDFGYTLMVFCSGKPPFDNELVRKAVQVGIDREAINELVYGGHGEPAYGFWPSNHRYYNPDVEKIVTYDPEAARGFIEESGVTDLAVDMYITSEPYSRLAQVLQQQLGQIGFEISIVNSRDVVSEFIGPQLPGILLIPGSRTGLDKYGRVFTPGGQQALCGVGRPEIMDIVTPAAGLAPDDPAAIEAHHEAELMIAEHAYIVPIAYVPQFTAYNTERVGGELVYSATRRTRMYELLYIKR